MYTSLMVVDDFLDNPHDVRNAALKLDYPDIQGAFPGRNSLQRLNLTGLEEQVSRLLGERVEPISPLESHGKCRITLAGDKGRGNVHIDKSHWSGILYLSLPEHCSGGTEFFRHRPTMSDRAPLSREELAAMKLGSFDDVYTEIIEKQANDAGKWEKVMDVAMRFNRLVLLRPWLWHTAGPAFGDSRQNGRLVYLMFFKTPGTL